MSFIWSRVNIETPIMPILWAALACVSRADAQATVATSASNWPPLQLEMSVPFEPTAFPSTSRVYLTYELQLRNFTKNPLTLRRVEVLDADNVAAAPITSFEAEQIDALLQPIGAQMAANGSDDKRREIGGGRSAVLFLSIALDRDARIPNNLRHRVLTTDAAVEGAVIGTHHIPLRTLGPPVKGADWLASAGPSNDSYHRRGILVFEGRALIDRRYAIDWMRVREGATVSGGSLNNHSYYAYGQEVLAVADGKIVAAKDGIPDNVPRHEGFRAAVPITMETMAGNTITLDVGGGQFAYYMHLQPGSVRVKAGDRVRRGQVLAKIGNSGDTREPHLHLEVTTSPKLLAGEGVPYLVDKYRIESADGSKDLRTDELPLEDMLIDFGP